MSILQNKKNQHPISVVNPDDVSLDSMMETAYNLTHRLKQVEVFSRGALLNEDILNDIEVIERWVESYRRGLAAARKISDSGLALMQSVQARLALAIEEQQRLEDEGNSPMTRKQQHDIEALRTTHARLQRVTQDMETIFDQACCAPTAPK